VVAAYLGLGSNLGDRLGTLQAAVDRLAIRGVRAVRSSRVYATEPVGGPPQPQYLNVVIDVRTDAGARQLLAACLGVESELGRRRAVRWGPRTIDIDVLSVEATSSDDPDLVLPHPRMHRRAFVLAPLLELDARPALPGGLDIGRVRTDALGFDGVRVAAPPLVVPKSPA
jgi:2-amino-4-hydroxy-6-hydroxymethyldihydropteridine diphosphokinase